MNEVKYWASRFLRIRLMNMINRTVVRLLLIPLLLVPIACEEDASDAGVFEELARESLSQIEGEIEIPGLQDAVEVIRDPWGVPHIYAENLEDLFFAQGFVQAQDRLWQMEMWKRFNGGRLAEVMGPEALEHDRILRLIQYQGPWDEEEFAVYHPEGERIFSSFVEGVNAFIEHRQDNLPVEFKLTGIEPEPWTIEDAVMRVPARSLGSARSELNLALQVAELGPEEANRRDRPSPWVELQVAPGLDLSLITEDVVASLDGTLATVPFPAPPLLPEYQGLEGAVASLDFGVPELSPGSNNWVARGELTASGEVLLANDPHRQVTNPSLRYLVHLNAPGWNVIGATEPAIPGVAIGHNGRIGWGLTIVGTDYDDVFVEELNPENSREAMWEGEWYPLDIVVDTIPVRGQEPQVVEHFYSRHGFIFHKDTINHVAFSVRSTLKERGTAEYLGALRLNQTDLAGNCQEFLDQQAYYYAPSENMICGDVDGNIAWHASALTPDRGGLWYGRLPVPGTGGYEWVGYRDNLPQEYNPERGWLGTANHDIHPEGYYPPVGFRSPPFSRFDRLEQIFAEARDLTPEDYEEMLYDAYWTYTEEDRTHFEGWTAEDEDVEWARALLADWDGYYDRESVAASVHNYWRDNLDDYYAVLEGEVPEAERDAQVRSALQSAMSDLRAELGSDRSEWRWGRLHRSEFPHWLAGAYDLPGVERSGGGGTVAATGATFREIIDFSDLDNSRATSTPGQSAQPGSPFYDNLLDLWANGEFFPLLYTREAVEQNVEYRLQLVPAGSGG